MNMEPIRTKYLPFVINEAGVTLIKALPVRCAVTRHDRLKVWPAYEELAPDVAEQVKRQIKHGSHAAHIL